MNLTFQQRPVRMKIVILSVIIAILIGAIFILINGSNPFEVYGKLITGAFGSVSAIASTLRWTTPLLFTTIASAISFQGGMFNMGVEGQMYIGAMAATIVGVSFTGLPPIVHISLCFGAAMLAGLIFALIPALMRVYLNASEIVVTLMLNYAIVHFCDYLIQEHFLATDAMVSTIATSELPQSARLQSLMPPYLVNAGLIIGVIMVVLFFVLMKKSKWGYEIHLSGINPEFARYGGLSVNRIRISVMLISGLIAGLGGAIEIMGVQKRMISGFSPNFGFDGMLAALLGNSTPFGVTLSAVFMGSLKAGALSIERTAHVSRALADIIKGMIICFISARTLGFLDFDFKKLFKRNKNKGLKEGETGGY